MSNSHDNLLHKALKSLESLKEIYEVQLAAVSAAMHDRDIAKLELDALRIQTDMKIRDEAGNEGEKKSTEAVIASRVTLALRPFQLAVLDKENTYRLQSNKLEMVRFSIECRKLEVKAHLPHASQVIHLSPPSTM